MLATSLPPAVDLQHGRDVRALGHHSRCQGSGLGGFGQIGKHPDARARTQRRAHGSRLASAGRVHGEVGDLGKQFGPEAAAQHATRDPQQFGLVVTQVTHAFSVGPHTAGHTLYESPRHVAPRIIAGHAHQVTQQQFSDRQTRRFPVDEVGAQARQQTACAGNRSSRLGKQSFHGPRRISEEQERGPLQGLAYRTAVALEYPQARHRVVRSPQRTVRVGNRHVHHQLHGQRAARHGTQLASLDAGGGQQGRLRVGGPHGHRGALGQPQLFGGQWTQLAQLRASVERIGKNIAGKPQPCYPVRTPATLVEREQ